MDLLTKVSIAKELKAKLISSVVGAWEMNGNNNTLEQGEKEIETMRGSMRSFEKMPDCILYLQSY